MNPKQLKIGKKWMEYQGCNNWEGLLDPIDDTLRCEILRYGKFVEATYNAFDFDPSSSSYATCLYPKHSLLNQLGLSQAGYRLTKNLHATSGIQLPRWTERFPTWVSNQSSWIGYVAVCQDEQEIERLGRRDVVIAFRGTATCLEWLENLRATLTQFPNATCGSMVERGFLSLYTSCTANLSSLQDQVKQEIRKILQMYRHEPISLTITGHSLGAALATLAAYDITTSFDQSPPVSVISFGGPRVGNQSFRCQVEKCGSKILRVVNSSDLITKVPGFAINCDEVEANEDIHVAGVGLPKWLHKPAENTQWVYADVGCKLQLCTGNSPNCIVPNVATCHELDTYLHLVNGFMSSTCPFKRTALKTLKAYVR
ncbi:Phospholipase a1-chloroplastic-like [Thalictrum thalictroides]|uniref:Phospholipase a1-chloroplastic-like n=1 Tax=Thalictrum thalictroides TaxID=46969 RepID=A0A7J6UUB7_THATH|nr:Phospholipase a1-chloroplastic-like [Thalictrum thalictroides]